MKKILGVYSAPPMHWVGDGFPVRSMFSYGDHGRQLSPFLLLDHAGPAEFAPAMRPRGVGQHPHRGFETVTIVYQGEVDHRDSTGAGGHIGPGDVQWMTAAAGIVHEEFHSEAFTRRGGTMEMVQLWVNLPASQKLCQPGYQTLLKEDIPQLSIAGGAGRLRVIAGEYQGQRGPARTSTPMNVWDLQLDKDAAMVLELPEGHTLGLVVLHGALRVNDEVTAANAQLVILEREGTQVRLQASSDVKLLVLGGEPIDEPVVGYGPFVMNTQEEIRQAVVDYNAGRFGSVSA